VGVANKAIVERVCLGVEGADCCGGSKSAEECAGGWVVSAGGVAAVLKEEESEGVGGTMYPLHSLPLV